MRFWRVTVMLTLVYHMAHHAKAQSSALNDERKPATGYAFSQFWSESTDYEYDNMLTRFRWRRLHESEIHAPTGMISEKELPRLCEFEENNAKGRWRLIQILDINGPAFQSLIEEYTEFGSYRLDGRITLQHKLVVQSMRTVNSSTSTTAVESLLVVLTVGGERRDFQIDVYPRSRSRGRAVPTDVLCVLSKKVVLTTVEPPAPLKFETSTISASRSTTSSDQVYLVDCSINNIADVAASGVFDGHLTSLDAFLVRYRAVIFILTVCSVTLLVLVIALLLCLYVRYRKLRRTAQREKHQMKLSSGKIFLGNQAPSRSVPVKMSTRETIAVENSSYSENDTLWRKKQTSPSAAAHIPLNYPIKNTGCCDESGADFATCQRHRSHNLHHQKAGCRSPRFSPSPCDHEANKSLPPLPICASVELGAIAARRALSTKQNVSNGAIYSSLDTNDESFISTTPREFNRVTTFELV